MMDFKKIKHLYGDRYRSTRGKWKTNCCALSGLPLKTGDPVVIIPIIEDKYYQNGWITVYKPVTLPVFGKYSPTIGLQYQRKQDKCEKIINSMTELILGSMVLFPGEVRKGRVRKRWSSFIEMIQKQPGECVPAILPHPLSDPTRYNSYQKYEIRLAMIHKEIYLDMISAFRVAWSDIPGFYFQEDGNEIREYRKCQYNSVSTHIDDLLELLGRFYYHGLTDVGVGGYSGTSWSTQNGYLYNTYFTTRFSEYHFDGIGRPVKRYKEVLRSKSMVDDDFSIKLLVEQFKDLWILDHIMGYLRKPWCKEDSNYSDNSSARWLSPEILLKHNEVVSKFIKNHYPIKGDLEKGNLYNKTYGIYKKPM